MICFPNCKINLGLNVLRRREDGYHDIETVFYPVPLCDMLEIITPDVGYNISFQATGIKLSDDKKDNLVYRATKKIAELYDLPKLRIRLHKLTPFGAGLGGGSSDCANSILTINKLCHLGMTNDQMRAIATSLGADCAFFIENKPVIARGIGDQMTPIDLSLAGKQIMIIKPDISVSTKMAYANIVPKEPEFLLEDVLQGSIFEWRDKLTNDFEASIFQQFPEIAKIKEWFYERGAIYSAMSGSGSAVFGIFDDEFNLENLKILHNFGSSFAWTGTLL